MKLCREGLHRGHGGRQGGADLGLVEHLEEEVAAEQEEAKRAVDVRQKEAAEAAKTAAKVRLPERLRRGLQRERKCCVLRWRPDASNAI